MEDITIRISSLIALSAILSAPLLIGCTVNTSPAQPVVVQERVVAPPQAVVAPPVVLQRY